MELDGEQGLNFAGWAKKLTGAATISVGSVGLSGEFLGAFSGETSTSVGLDRLVERMARDDRRWSRFAERPLVGRQGSGQRSG